VNCFFASEFDLHFSLSDEFEQFTDYLRYEKDRSENFGGEKRPQLRQRRAFSGNTQRPVSARARAELNRSKEFNLGKTREKTRN